MSFEHILFTFIRVAQKVCEKRVCEKSLKNELKALRKEK